MFENQENGQVDPEQAVRERYSSGARAREEALCCPVSYDTRLLEVIPDEVVERDYGCGDPARHVRPGETVLDLGSGTGKACFMAAQVVGAEGRVIGVDMNDDMLELARKSAPVVAERVGYANVEFRKARIQDLRLDRERLDARLRERPVSGEEELRELEEWLAELQQREPLVADESIDVVVSNCVLNLVRPGDKARLFSEIHRVLRRGGRAVISDIVSDEPIPEHLQADPELWSGCISGAFEERAFLEAFESAGFHGMTILERQEEPWRKVEGIELRSLTVAAWKGKEGPCWDHRQAVIYKGPFKKVEDDDGHVLLRGARMAVCEKTFRLFAQDPYRDHVELVEPAEPVDPTGEEGRVPFACDDPSALRDPRETKGAERSTTPAPADGDCSPGCC